LITANTVSIGRSHANERPPGGLGHARAGLHLTTVQGTNILAVKNTNPEVRLMAGDSDRTAELLQRWAKGDRQALGALAPVIYQDLRRLAHRQLRSERAGHTLQSTALVNEAYIRLFEGQPCAVSDRGHFVAVASRAMRQILVEYARGRRAQKRNGGYRIALEEIAELPISGEEELVALDGALEELSRLDERQGRIVEMRFFGGLSMSEIADVLEISVATVKREWSTARIWLRREMSRPSAP
jgi:RNA polymerase sigma factor (TIGR02999 family)